MLGRLIPRVLLDSSTRSGLYDHDTFYSTFIRDISSCKSELIIESPFITMRRILVLSGDLRRAINRGVSIIVNTKPLEEHDEYFRGEAEVAVEYLQSFGMTVLFTGGHHRKLAVIDRKILWEGSLNILSQADSCEIMRRIDSEKLAQHMINFVGLNHYVG